MTENSLVCVWSIPIVAAEKSYIVNYVNVRYRYIGIGKIKRRTGYDFRASRTRCRRCRKEVAMIDQSQSYDRGIAHHADRIVFVPVSYWPLVSLRRGICILLDHGRRVARLRRSTGARQQSQQCNCQLSPSCNYHFIHISCFLLIYSNMKQRLMICIRSKNKKIFRKKQAKNTGGVHFFHQQRKCMSTHGAPRPPLFGKRTGLAAYRITINMR